MKKFLLIAGLVMLLAPVIAFAYEAFFNSQRADYGWSPNIAEPGHQDDHPVVVIDEAHHNASTADFTGRFWPFARLLRADGYDVRRGKQPFTRESLDGVDVLVVANASGASRRQLFGINLSDSEDLNRGAAAFTEAEIASVRDWVEGGGSLLLIADHAPFGSASAELSGAFGVRMHQGFTEVPDELSDPLLFSRDNGRLGEHSILAGATAAETITRVMTFTGQSLDATAEAVVLLRLPESAIEYVPRGDSFVEEPAGEAQGVALTIGQGRVVVLGEAAMATAQVYRREPFGMNTPGNDNQQFVLNVMHWLSRDL